MNVEFKFDLGEKVVLPNKIPAIVQFCVYENDGNVYYVRTIPDADLCKFIEDQLSKYSKE